MLTDTNEQTAVNSPYLYKLKDRFPLQINLESSDIAEICYRRLLKKSPEGETLLEKTFSEFGPRLISRTKLSNNTAYDSPYPLNESSFGLYYPFLPVHFSLLLNLLRELAKNRGGVALRSAIKVIQDILTGGHVNGMHEDGLISRPCGTLASGVWFYDALHTDMGASNKPHMYAVSKTLEAYKNNDEYTRVAKTLAVVTLLPEFNASPDNITALMQDSVEASLSCDEVKNILQRMATDRSIPIGDDADGSYHYLTEAEERLDQERNDYTPLPSDVEALQKEIFTEVFKDVLKIQPYTGLSVGTSLFYFDRPDAIKSDETSPLRLSLALYPRGAGNSDLTKRVTSDSYAQQSTVYLLSPRPDDWDQQLTEILKSKHMAQTKQRNFQYRAYVNDQNLKAQRDHDFLVQSLRQSLSEGEVICQGTSRALTPGSNTFISQMKAKLENLSQRIYDKYNQAAATMRTGDAKLLLQASPNRPLDKKADPLQLIDTQSGQLQLRDNPACASVCDLLNRQDETQGGALLDSYTKAPYGWAKEVTQYILAALFVTGRIKLNISGRRYLTANKAVEDAFSSPRNFKMIGIRLREDGLNDDQLMDCQNFLTNQGIAGIPISERDILSSANQFVEQKYTESTQFLTHLENNGLGGTQILQRLKNSLDKLRNSTDLRDFLSAVSSPDQTFEADLAWLNRLIQTDKNKDLFSLIARVRESAAKISDYPEEIKTPLKKAYHTIQESLQKTTFIDDITPFSRFIKQAETAEHDQKEKKQDEYDELLQEYQNKVKELADLYALEEAGRRQLLSLLPSAPSQNASVGVLNTALYELRKSGDELETEARKIQASSHKPVVRTTRNIRIPSTIRDAASLQSLIKRLQELAAQMPNIEQIKVELEE